MPSFFLHTGCATWRGQTALYVLSGGQLAFWPSDHSWGPLALSLSDARVLGPCCPWPCPPFPSQAGRANYNINLNCCFAGVVAGRSLFV